MSSINSNLSDCINTASFYHKNATKKSGKYETKNEFMSIFKLTEKRNNLKYALDKCSNKDKKVAKLNLCYAQFANFMENIEDSEDDEISREQFDKKVFKITKEINTIYNFLEQCKNN